MNIIKNFKKNEIKRVIFSFLLGIGLGLAAGVPLSLNARSVTGDALVRGLMSPVNAFTMLDALTSILELILFFVLVTESVTFFRFFTEGVFLRDESKK